MNKYWYDYNTIGCCFFDSFGSGYQKKKATFFPLFFCNKGVVFYANSN